jgi:hypothetical protein
VLSTAQFPSMPAVDAVQEKIDLTARAHCLERAHDTHTTLLSITFSFLSSFLSYVGH